MLAQAHKMMEEARKRKYAVGAFNTSNLEVTQGIIRAANERKSPVVLQVSETTIKYAGLRAITQIVLKVAEREGKDIPVALHLDHGRSFHSITECIKAGFSSVMIDASDLSIEENVALTRQVVEFAHEKKVFVQGELGRVGGMHGRVGLGRKGDLIYTRPREAKEFVERTNVDSLAVSIGTAHGLYKAKLRFDILREIRKVVNLPLVLHGASGVAPQDIRRVIKGGINKINIDTELRIAFTRALKLSLLKQKKEIDPRKILAPATEAVSNKVSEKLELFGSVDKAYLK